MYSVLWALRLVFPCAFTSALSLLPDTEPVQGSADASYRINTGVEGLDTVVNRYLQPEGQGNPSAQEALSAGEVYSFLGEVEEPPRGIRYTLLEGLSEAGEAVFECGGVVLAPAAYEVYGDSPYVPAD